MLRENVTANWPLITSVCARWTVGAGRPRSATIAPALARFDAHTHLFAPSQAARRAEIAARDATFAEMYADPKAAMATLPQLLAALDGAGIARAVAAGFAFTSAADIEEQNASLLEAARASDGRVVALATVNPALAGWERAAEAALAGGARGFGELRPHNQRWDPEGAAAHDLCELAGAHGAVLLWHVSEPVGHAYPGKRGGIAPEELIRLAAAHPGVRMVAAHLGAGLSFYLQMPEVRAAIEFVYFDTAAYPLLYDEQSVMRLVALAGTKRVLFGSDYPLLSPARQLRRLEAVLGEDVAEAVCGGNAETLFPGNHTQ